jgi:hypothetical protein
MSSPPNNLLTLFVAAIAGLLSGFSVLAQGAPAWADARSVGARFPWEGTASVAVDAAGNTYEAGSFNSTTFVIDGVTLTNQGGGDVYLAKYAPTGSLAWVRQIGSTGNDIGMGVTLDASGNAYVTGIVGSAVALGNNLTLTGNNSAFLVRYSPQGVPEWRQQSTSTNEISGSSVATDAAGSVYLVGAFRRSFAFGTVAVAAPNNEYGVYLARFSAATGTVQAVTLAFYYAPPMGAYQIAMPKLAVGATGDAYVFNTFALPAIFSSTTLTSRGGDDGLVARYTPLGALVWVQQLGGTYADAVNDGKVDAAGNVYVAGNFSNRTTIGSTALTGAGLQDGFLAKYSAQGNMDWVQALIGPGYDNFTRVALDAQGNPHVAGEFSAGAPLGPQPLPNAGGLDLVVAAFNPLGQLRWHQHAGGPGADTSLSLNLPPAGDVLLMGRFANTCLFGALSLSTSATSATFLARLNGAVLGSRAPRFRELGCYPNPTNAYIHVPALPVGTPVHVLDALGRVARASTVSAAATVSVQGLAPGLYTLHATDAQGRRLAAHVAVE